MKNAREIGIETPGTTLSRHHPTPPSLAKDNRATFPRTAHRSSKENLASKSNPAQQNKKSKVDTNIWTDSDSEYESEAENQLDSDEKYVK